MASLRTAWAKLARPLFQKQKYKKTQKGMVEGTREKVRSKRINLEGNTHAQEIQRVN
jgi:hypothetical protein